MTSISSLSLSGMNAAQTALSASAYNIANLDVVGFRRQQVEQASAAPSGVSTMARPTQTAGDAIPTDLVDMLQAKNAFLANLAVFKTGARMTGTLLSAVG